MIPIFDSLSHPTINKDWILPKYAGASSIDVLIKQMKEAGIKKSLAVGMKGIGDYDQDRFISLINPHLDCLVPIAYYDFNESDNLHDIHQNLERIKSQGYKGIKLHPRFSDFSLTSRRLADTINKATELSLVSLLCTYFTHNSNSSTNNNLDTLCTLLMKVQDCRLVLLHSGTTHVLDMIDIGRSFKNVLLDMSFTMSKYEGSSIDLDLKFAFRTFDQRICIGADWPEFSMSKLRERFDYLTEGLNDEKKENIAYKNLDNFIF
jgi:predicted TIM-barrel fold metal-dependent hydrolase